MSISLYGLEHRVESGVWLLLRISLVAHYQKVWDLCCFSLYHGVNWNQKKHSECHSVSVGVFTDSFFFAAAALADGEEKKVEAAAEVDGGFRGVELKVVVAFRYSEAIKKHKKMGTMADALLMKCGPPYAEKKPGH